jgi:hypothetical protein
MWRILEGTMATNLKIDQKRRGRLKARPCEAVVLLDTSVLSVHTVSSS